MYFSCCCNGVEKWSDGPFKHLQHNKQIIIIFKMMSEMLLVVQQLFQG